MILAYRILTTILYPLLILLIYFRKIIKKEDPLRFKEKIFPSCFNVKRKENGKLIWFHSASIGEFKSILPVVNQLTSKNKKIKFLITTTTLSSANLAKTELAKFSNVEHRFLPLDVQFLVEKFLRLWKPNKIFLVDSEIWPNLIFKASQFKIPIAIINARLTAKTFKRWKLFPGSAKKIFKKFDLCLCSNLETKKYLKELNAKNIHFKGNIKLIDQINEKKLKNNNRNFLLKKRFWFAASTHKGEDIFCLKTHLQLKKNYNDIITIIAPRHIERAKSIKSLSERFNLNTQILDKNKKIYQNKEVIIINHFGVLKNYFKYAKSVFIGKSTIKKLRNDSGQDPIEAAKLGCRVYHGPYTYNFKDIYKILKKNGISKQVKNYEELSSHLLLDLRNSSKSKNSNINLIKDLGKKTLIDTMKLLNNFIK
tara:strand:- start:3966 stop:5237 length:1272 start_codon:yes stop_codon:yes gene_type:complete